MGPLISLQLYRNVTLWSLLLCPVSLPCTPMLFAALPPCLFAVTACFQQLVDCTPESECVCVCVCVGLMGRVSCAFVLKQTTGLLCEEQSVIL